MIKPIAFYLPQFHETEENNRWWGKGFTEWTSVRKAKALYAGHRQPRAPLDQNYYNLLEKDTMRWQADLAKQYRIYGFCMYHYYFKDGKKLLEKPAENLLRWKEIDIHFCFSWANEPWIRTWSNLEGNDWNEIRDKELMASDQKGESVLMEQDYGNREDWKEHFAYLLPFFKDERYIKIDEMPVFLIYKAQNIECLDAMLAYWDELARQNGFGGLYVLSTNCMISDCKFVKGMVRYEPSYTRLFHMKLKSAWECYFGGIEKRITGRHLRRFDFARVWKRIISSYNKEDNIFPGAYVGYDDTPRRGGNGEVHLGAKPDVFGAYFKELVKKCGNDQKDYIFITAWNEWAEGAYMEPDETYACQWLDEIRKAVEEEENDKKR